MHTSFVVSCHLIECSEDSTVSVCNNLYRFGGSAHILNEFFEEVPIKEIPSIVDSGFFDTRAHHTDDGLYFHLTVPWNEV